MPARKRKCADRALLAPLRALSALPGRALDIAALEQGLASSAAMNPGTAVCLALLGLEAVRLTAFNALAALAKAGQAAILSPAAGGLTGFYISIIMEI